MEEDWWGGDESQDPASSAPKEIVISGPGGSGNTLTGGVNQISEDGQNGVWGQVDEKDSTRSRSVIWFFIGLIVVPVLLGGISTFLNSMAETGGYDEEYSRNPTVIDNVTIDDRTFETYGFSVSSDFHHDFDDPSWWDLSTGGERWYSWTDSYEFGDPDLQAVDYSRIPGILLVISASLCHTVEKCGYSPQQNRNYDQPDEEPCLLYTSPSPRDS